MVSMYSAKVMEHFANPHNVGEIPDANGVGEVGNPKCGDIMRMYLKIENNVIVDVKFLTFGCGAAIATSSMATDLIKGKTIDEALKLTNKAVVEALEGLPPSRCTALCWPSRRSRLPCLTTTAVRALIRNPLWASWKKTVTIAAVRAARSEQDPQNHKGWFPSGTTLFGIIRNCGESSAQICLLNHGCGIWWARPSRCRAVFPVHWG